MTGYDTWKAREPEYDEEHWCSECGHYQIYSLAVCSWICERCDEREDMANIFGITLDQAIDAFEANKNDDTAVMLRVVAQEYEADEMISEEEMWDLIARSDEVTDRHNPGD